MRHAIVMGGSIAGLTAAAALARHADAVTVLERDGRDGHPIDAEPRRAVPQGNHVHALLNAGRKALDALLPGILDELVDGGGHCLDWCRDVQWFHAGRWRLRHPSDYRTYWQSRPYLEAHVRRRVGALDNVTLRFGAAVDRLVHRNGRVEAVTLRGGEAVTGDLFVDATGRGSSTAERLVAWGYAAPPVTEIEVDIGYVSRFVERPEADDDWRALMVFADPPRTRRGAAVFPVEGDRWIVSLVGYHGAHPPLDDAGWLAFARGLDHPAAARALDGARLLSPPKKFVYRKMIRRHYERLRRLPRNLAVVGDAVCSFDPLFGQGMSVAAIGATRLDAHLRRGPYAARRFQRQLARVADVPWLLAGSEAFRFPETRGRDPVPLGMGGVFRRFVDRLYDRCADDPEVYAAFVEVMHLDEGPASLMRPRVLARLLAPGRRRLTAPADTA